MNLSSPQTEVSIKNFSEIKNRAELALFLGVSESTLNFLLYILPKDKSYKKFYIKKKSGGEREIVTPISAIMTIQKRLVVTLNSIYKPRNCVFGFMAGKSIVDNAKQHKGSKNVFNIDLDNFFPSIHIGRVIGLFKAQPFNFNKEVATTLAQICCYEAKLPQGAPTSPTVSNMICFRLDQELQRLANKHYCTYSRYADDITFSKKNGVLPLEIVDSHFKCGKELNRIIVSNNFKINDKKVRLQKHYARQEVTGLIVNEFANIKRKFVRDVRALLYSWKKDTLAVAEKKYFMIRGVKPMGPGKSLTTFKQIVWGKISYIGLVKGKSSPVYRRLANMYNKQARNGRPELPLDPTSEIKRSLWVIHNYAEIDGKDDSKQGTGFFLKDFGLITAAHVVSEGDRQEIEVFRYDSPSVVYTAKVTKRLINRDIAILEIINFDLRQKYDLEMGKGSSVQEEDQLRVAGFPSYHEGDTPNIKRDHVTSIHARHGSTSIVVSLPLTAGMSGGPMVDRDNKVVGVITKGLINGATTETSEYYAGVLIDYISESSE